MITEYLPDAIDRVMRAAAICREQRERVRFYENSGLPGPAAEARELLRQMELTQAIILSHYTLYGIRRAQGW